MSFLNLLIQTCSIQEKTSSTTSYEKTVVWNNIATGVICRKEAGLNVKISDNDFRSNADDDTFFFMPNVVITRGNRIILDNEIYDVIKVNKILNSVEIHHIEVTARLVDNK